MRLLILSFFAVLLGYSLLFDQREETKPKVDSQEVTTSSNVMAPHDSDSIALLCQLAEHNAKFSSVR